MRWTAVVAGLAIVLAGCATMAPRGEEARGYLMADKIDAIARAVPTPAAFTTPKGRAEQDASDQYRAFENTDRWFLATAHVELRPPEAAQHFDCALGVRFASEPRPALTRIMDRLLHDIEGAASIAKATNFRARPVGVDPDRDACQRLTPEGRASGGYPSSSASAGAAYGELMAVLAPDRASEARRIGREIGISRLVCGMHYPADVTEGEALGLAVWQAAKTTPGFADDLAVARIEVAAARGSDLTNPGCAAERLALAAPLP